MLTDNLKRYRTKIIEICYKKVRESICIKKKTRQEKRDRRPIDLVNLKKMSKSYDDKVKTKGTKKTLDIVAAMMKSLE